MTDAGRETHHSMPEWLNPFSAKTRPRFSYRPIQALACPWVKLSRSCSSFQQVDAMDGEVFG